MNKYKILIPILLLAITQACFKKSKTTESMTIPIDTAWQFAEEGSKKWQIADVPGSVHINLLNNDKIDDPFYRDNEKKLQWIEDKNWVYQTTFDAGEQIFDYDNAELVFEGLDTHAKVFLNDSLILEADNMFREWRLDVKHLIEQGKNKLRILFESPVEYNKKEAAKLSYKLPDERVFTRKAPYQFGWDWGPRFVTSGIWKPVYLQLWNNAKIRSLQIISKTITENKAKLTARFTIDATNDMDAMLSISNQTVKQQNGKQTQLTKGENIVDIDFEIINPNFWFPVGYGEPFRYHFEGMLKINDIITERIETDYGIRKIELVQENDSTGKSFMFKINGIPVFAKGANYIPQDNFLSRVDTARYQKLFQQVKDANINMLRVWGGGIYENNIFYDLCDKNGIMVWQDFMFACAMYPGDEAFLKNVEQEVVDNVVRLRNHPSIVLWCGNNEIDNGWKDWGWQKTLNYSDSDSAKIWNDYLALFEQLIPNLLKKHDNSRPYWPSSPSYGWGHDKSHQEGDSHYWGVWWGKEPFDVYRQKVGRFMSEYGFQSFPPIHTIDSFAKPEDKKLYSKVMQTHQKHPVGNQTIELYMKRHYKTPENFNNFVYLSQLLQAKGMGIAIEAHRTSKPHCMGTLYWQLNDCWPVASWAGLDYYYHKKAFHYHLKYLYADVLISPQIQNDTIDVFVVSDRTKSFDAQIGLKLLDFNGKVLNEKNIEAEIPENSSKIYFTTIYKDFADRAKKEHVLLLCEITDNKNDNTYRNILYFVPPKEQKLPEPTIEKEVEVSDDGYIVHLKTDKLAKGVYVRFNGDSDSFSDNYFDMLPGETKTIRFTEINPPYTKPLVVSTIRDTYK